MNVVCWRFVFLHFRIINWGVPRLDGLFYVICLSLPLIAHFCVFFNVFFVCFVSCLSFFAFSAVVFFLLTLFLPCLSKTKLTGGLSPCRSGAQALKKRALGVRCVLAVEICGRRTMFFFCRVAAFLMERKRNCAGTVWRCLWGRALFACFSCGALLLFILVFALLGRCGGVCGAVRFLPVFSCGALLLFYFGFGSFCLELTKGGYFFMMFL